MDILQVNDVCKVFATDSTNMCNHRGIWSYWLLAMRGFGSESQQSHYPSTMVGCNDLQAELQH